MRDLQSKVIPAGGGVTDLPAKWERYHMISSTIGLNIHVLKDLDRTIVLTVRTRLTLTLALEWYQDSHTPGIECWENE